MWENRAVSVYPKCIEDLCRAPVFAGNCADSSGDGRSASFVCGSSFRFQIRIEGPDKQVTDICYRTNGCGFAVAGAEAISKAVMNSSLTELHGTDQLEANLELRLGPVDSDRLQCTQLVLAAFRDALTNHRRRIVNEFSGEEALVCTCFGISEESLVEVIKTQNVSDLNEVAEANKAGTGCGSCRMLIQELIDSRDISGV